MEQNSPSKCIRSLNEFIEVLINKTIKFGNDKLWFRGENSDKYELVPNLYRMTNKELTYCRYVDPKTYYILEQNIDTSFYRKSFNYFSNHGIVSNRWNRYFLKQHYGLKTRLLDWSENAMFALFFALTNNYKENENARFWILSPFELNNYSINKLVEKKGEYKIILTLPDFERGQEIKNEDGELSQAGLGRKYYTLNCKEGETLYPIAIYPPHLDTRMAAQQSCFTLFGNEPKGLNIKDSQETILDYIDIDSNYKQKILQELKLIGISSYSVFPDLDGLGKDIREDLARDIENSQDNSNLYAFFR
jgi:hypothetical protein